MLQIGTQYWFKGWRKYYHINPAEDYQGKIVTDLIDLEADKLYKIRAQHKDFGGGYWASFAVEFMQPGSENHPMAAKAVQSWRIE